MVWLPAARLVVRRRRCPRKCDAAGRQVGAGRRVEEVDGAGGRARAWRIGGDRRRESDALADVRRAWRRTGGRRGTVLVDDLVDRPTKRSCVEVAIAARVSGGNRVTGGTERAGGQGRLVLAADDAQSPRADRDAVVVESDRSGGAGDGCASRADDGYGRRERHGLTRRPTGSKTSRVGWATVLWKANRPPCFAPFFEFSTSKRPIRPVQCVQNIKNYLETKFGIF